MKTASSFVIAVLLLATWSCSQEEPPKNAPKKPATETQDPVAEMQELFKEQGIEVDREKKTITVPCEFANPDMPLEYVLVHRKGKGVESLLQTEVRGSILNAAFLLLGYQKGQNATVKDRDPLPTPEEVANGAPIYDVTPPKGMKVWFSVRWETLDEEGQIVKNEARVEDLIYDAATDKKIVGSEWIFLGGRMTPLYRGEAPVFIADYEGNYISVVYKDPPSHLVTMRHEAADDDQRFFWTELRPEVGTKAKLVIHAVPHEKLHPNEKPNAEPKPADKKAADKKAGDAPEAGDAGKAAAKK